MPDRARALLEETERFIRSLVPLRFSPPVAAVYNPLVYAAAPYRNYLRAYGAAKKRVLFLGMNPGPWGMAQTGIPFGEIESVKTWLAVTGTIGHPEKEHAKRPITGWECTRSEVSGRRLWGLMKERFGTPENFFADHFVANYCPLVFMGETGRNITPDKLTKEERAALFEQCDRHLAAVLTILEPQYLIGIGRFAEKRLLTAAATLESGDYTPVISWILHPSPANPRANRNWKETAAAQLVSLGIW